MLPSVIGFWRARVFGWTGWSRSRGRGVWGRDRDPALFRHLSDKPHRRYFFGAAIPPAPLAFPAFPAFGMDPVEPAPFVTVP
jgi:hypothetical protein